MDKACLYRTAAAASADWLWEVAPDFEKISIWKCPDNGEGKSRLFGRYTLAEFIPNAESRKLYLERLAQRDTFRDLPIESAVGIGGTRHLLLCGAPIFRAGVFKGYAGTCRETTITPHALSQTNQRLLQAIECINQAFGLFDSEERLALCNQRYREVYRRNGTDPTSAMAEVGMSLRDLLELRVENGLNVVPSGQSVESYIEERRRGILKAARHMWQTADGRWFDIVLQPMPDGGLVTLWNDITALKRGEEERHQLEVQLHHSQRLEALGTLAGGIAHDLNNALVPVLALTKLVAKALPAGSREGARLETIALGAVRARELVNQILAFGRKEAVEKTKVDLASILHEAMDLLRPSLPSTIHIDINVAPTPALFANPGHLHQVIVNLVTNASQAIGSAHGTITISLGKSKLQSNGDAREWLRLSIADTGCGMDEPTRQRIFEPFFTTKAVGKGTGLGLSVVHGIVTSHGGTIKVSCRPDAGTRFDIDLPATES
jgi:signal transduction histidine kinase